MNETPELAALLARAERVLERLEAILPAPPEAPDWHASTAFRWRRRNGRAALEAVTEPHRIRLSDLKDVDEQKRRIEQNIHSFPTRRSSDHRKSVV